MAAAIGFGLYALFVLGAFLKLYTVKVVHRDGDDDSKRGRLRNAGAAILFGAVVYFIIGIVVRIVTNGIDSVTRFFF